MNMRKKSNYVYTPMYDIDLEMYDGEHYYIIGTFEPEMHGKIMLVGDEIPLYSATERLTIGLKDEDVPWIELPDGDVKLDITDGLLEFKRNGKVIFSTFRHHIKKSTTNLPKTFAKAEGK